MFSGSIRGDDRVMTDVAERQSHARAGSGRALDQALC
jgi:hypothetical protein